MPRFAKTLIFFSAVLFSHFSVAQTCDTPTTNHFIIHDDGTTQDTQTGLMWKRCSEGQTYQLNECIGAPNRYNYYEALHHVETSNSLGGFAGYTNWRVPHLKELSSLVDANCTKPAIDLVTFPNTPLYDWFWSSSLCDKTKSCAWFVAFYSHYYGIFSEKRFSKGYIRLVRHQE